MLHIILTVLSFIASLVLMGMLAWATTVLFEAGRDFHRIAMVRVHTYESRRAEKARLVTHPTLRAI